MPPIEFTQNYQDLSTDVGFQFKFFCERCGDGFMSTFDRNMLGTAGGMLRSASSFLGDIFGKAADSAYEIQRAVGGTAHDSALTTAVTEIKPHFKKCRRCGNWLCEKTCWNSRAGMCKGCAPIAEEEETSLRAAAVGSQVSNDISVEEEARLAAKKSAVATPCPKCGAATLGQKFCPECGTKIEAARFCEGCGTKLAPNAKFCGDCGHKVQ
ncbi:MAG: zinc ribbon domain-containing protein [Vicinamibacteria bacterium]